MERCKVGLQRERNTCLNEVSSLISPSSPSSEFVLLTALFLLGVRDVAGEPDLELAGEASLERAFRETVLPLSRACRRRSCIAATNR